VALDFGVVAANLDYLLWGRAREGEPGGLLLTIIMSLCAGALALAGGLLLAALAWIFGGALRRLLFLWADLMRAVPLLFVIFWLYFLLPVLFGDTPGAVTVILALAGFSAASVMHTTLAGLDALASGQAEAALATGLSRLQAWRLVLLPQVLPNLTPSFVGLLSALIKDTSLSFIVNVPELTTVAGQVNNQTQVFPAEIFISIGLMYVMLCGLLSLAAFAASRWRRQ
jgi:polar amino acid transport system permease protein